jgi:hypothetical protein
MPAEKISHRQWKGFLRSYREQHAGWLASFIPPGGPASPMGELRDIRLECLDGHDRIVFSFAREEHVVPHPRQLSALRTADGAHQGLEIVSDDGDVSRLQFREATRPETLDGMAPGERPGGRAA